MTKSLDSMGQIHSVILISRQFSGPNEFFIIIKVFFVFLIKEPNELKESNLTIHILQHADKSEPPLSNRV